VRVPPALGALMAVSLLLSVTWALVTPAFQAPDEQYHFAYVQSLAERKALPGDATRPTFSTQMARGIAGVNSDQVASQLDVRPEWSERAERRWQARDAQAARDDGGGTNPASSYPPTSYAWEALGYAAASGGSLFDELLGARLMSVLWLPLTVLGTWLLAGEVLGRRRVLQTAAAAVPALAPMVSFMTGAVSPDGMLYAVSTLALWLGVRAIRRDVPARDAVAFFALVAVACTIKTASVALLPAAALVAGLGVWARRHRRASAVRFGAAIVVPLVLALGTWALAADLTDQSFAAQIVESTSPVSAGSSAREFLSYLWQFYLPRTPVQYEYPFTADGLPLISIWMTHGWAAFGWLEVRFWDWVYWVLGAVSAAVGIAAVVALVRARRRVDIRVAAFLALAALALLAGLHWTDYRQLEAGALGFMQTRYLFPLIGVFGLALAGALSLVPARRRAGAVGATIAALFALDLLSLGLVLERFYA
jgi:4-amino-4-deoxy-L-arabinose transferase-like glycosyltransferase